jgi:eukaryotic-like serine/threonine-protein kinase
LKIRLGRDGLSTVSVDRPSNLHATAARRIGMTVDGKYRLKSVLGVGGMGIVYEAEHLFLSRVVALKILHPRYADTQEGAARFLKEARAAGTIGHRAIVTVMDAGFLDGTTPYLVMEKLTGENLEARIARRGGLRVRQAAIVLREMMKGLVAAHSKGIVHCDLKPANVFLVDAKIDTSHVKILDFGISKMSAIETMTARTDTGGHVLGTPQYMAPEQVQGGQVSDATDIYATGAVVYEALAGQPAFGGPSRVDLFIKILRDAPPPLVGKREIVPPPLAALVHKMLSKRVADRPESARDVVDQLDMMAVLPPPLRASSSAMNAAKPRRD